MPRAALISWDGDRGAIVLAAGPNTFHLTSTGDLQKDAETLARLCRYLQALAPELPPAQPKPLPEGPLPTVTDEELSRAQRFSSARAARGIKQPRSRVSYEDCISILDALEPPEARSQEPENDPQ